MTFKHRELRRLASLEAMGIQSYVSRRQLPGAAVTRRLAVVRSDAVESPPVATEALSGAGGSPGVSLLPQLGANARGATSDSRATPRRPPEVESRASVALRFNLALMAAGEWLWLEEIEEDAMSPDQMLLVQAMARALLAVTGAGASNPAAAPLQVEYFSWPLHDNRQLDQGEEAARYGVAGFLQRRLETRECSGLVLLGEACQARVSRELLNCRQVVAIAGTASMLADPLQKKQAWRELRRMCLSA